MEVWEGHTLRRGNRDSLNVSVAFTNLDCGGEFAEVFLQRRHRPTQVHVVRLLRQRAEGVPRRVPPARHRSSVGESWPFLGLFSKLVPTLRILYPGRTDSREGNASIPPLPFSLRRSPHCECRSCPHPGEWPFDRWLHGTYLSLSTELEIERLFVVYSDRRAPPMLRVTASKRTNGPIQSPLPLRPRTGLGRVRWQGSAGCEGRRERA